MTVDWTRFAEIVAAGTSFLLTSHLRPDCDSLGSELGLARALESLAKQVAIVNGDPLSRQELVDVLMRLLIEILCRGLNIVILLLILRKKLLKKHLK